MSSQTFSAAPSRAARLRAEWFANPKVELLSGLVVALALIPEAISFSIIAGVDPKVGLYASFSIAIIISFAGGRSGMISAATGAMALVLVPLVERPEGMTVLLTQRTAHLNSHAGQVSFPGGKTEPYDEHAEDTALRETEEEIGLPREHVELIGRLGTRTTGSGFRVTPVVGLIRPPDDFRPDPGEVETIFEVPLPFVLDPENHKTETRLIEGLERQFYVMPYENFYIWGLTARLLVALRNTLGTP